MNVRPLPSADVVTRTWLPARPLYKAAQCVRPVQAADILGRSSYKDMPPVSSRTLVCTHLAKLSSSRRLQRHAAGWYSSVALREIGNNNNNEHLRTSVIPFALQGLKQTMSQQPRCQCNSGRCPSLGETRRMPQGRALAGPQVRWNLCGIS